MGDSWDDVDAFYEQFGEPITLNGAECIGIVSRVNVTEPVVGAGLQTAVMATVRVRVSEIPTRPAARTVLSDRDGTAYRVMGADYGSTRQEWLLTCSRDV